MYTTFIEKQNSAGLAASCLSIYGVIFVELFFQVYCTCKYGLSVADAVNVL